jgi:hypothetical protein
VKPAANQIAFGLRAHTGWAELVAVVGPLRAPLVLYRARLQLCDGSWPRFVYHQAAEAATNGTPMGEVRALIRGAKKASRQAAAKAIGAAAKSVGAAGGRVTAGVVLVSLRKAPASLEAILAAHPLIHTAEGELYRAALLAGCKRNKLVGRAVPERELWPIAGKALRMNDAALRRRLETMGRAAGRPWGQDQKLAALAALVALAGE